MCGIAGVLDPERQTTRDRLTALVETMAATVHHRGPDGEGTWADATAGIALGHRRLSIIDPTPTGMQPMHSPAGRYVVTFNGEIYNYRELGAALGRVGVRFVGSSDTEVLTASLDRWGLDGTLERVDGMFAFAAWDRRRRQLHLVRDRFGEKPLYWGHADGRIVFGSELDALAAASSASTIDRHAVADILTYKCVQGSRSIYCEFQKVLPGQYLTVDHGHRVTSTRYWCATEVALDAMADPLRIGEREAAEELARRLEVTVGSRMVADVPVGAFLSGGIDSAGIAAFMVRASSGPVSTYTVGLDDPRYDESAAAKAVADRLGTVHHEARVTPAEVLDLVPRLSDVYDEPFADSSQLPTLLVSTVAARDVKVALTGDGGDEIFGGYNRHIFGARIGTVQRVLPATLRRSLGGWLQDLGPQRAETWFERVRPILPPHLRVRLPADKVHKLGRLLASSAPSEAYESLVSDPAGRRLSACAPAPFGSALDLLVANGLSFTQAVMIADTHEYLPNDILVKLDRAAMSASLETRAPYLDHQLFHWAWRLPLELRVSSGIGKRVLRSAVSTELDGLRPSAVKSGFGIPLDAWLRGPLRPWAQDLLAAEDDFVRQGALEAVWAAHLRGDHDHTHELWSVLMLRSWLAANRRPGRGTGLPT